MINLIPPSAKKGITLEYWKRVVAVWLCLFSTGFIMLSVFLLPTHITLRSEISDLEAITSASLNRVSSYDISATELVKANNLARLLLEDQSSTTPSDLITVLEESAGADVSISNFQFTKLATTPSITISGLAKSRQDLASFRDELAANKQFANVNLPISSLIKDKDLLYSMEITLATSTRL